MKSIISEFKLRGGKHCITNSLKQVFRYYGKSISEEMLYGIGSGLGFVYNDDKSIFYVSDRDNSNYSIRTPKRFVSEDFHLVEYSKV